MQWLFFEQYNVEQIIGSLRFWTLTGWLDRNRGWLLGSAKLERALWRPQP
jgi:glutathione S-transferase